MQTCLRLLWPRGRAWALVGNSALGLALGDIFEESRETVRSIVTESRPGMATETLEDWHAALGQIYDPSRPVAEQQARLESIRLSVGGMTLNQLQEQIAREFPGVTVSEVTTSAECDLDECGVAYCGGVDGDYSPLYYDVKGELADDYEALRVGAILAHYAPAHLIACSYLTVEGVTGTAECGVALCGIEECGSDGT